MASAWRDRHLVTPIQTRVFYATVYSHPPTAYMLIYMEWLERVARMLCRRTWCWNYTDMNSFQLTAIVPISSDICVNCKIKHSYYLNQPIFLTFYCVLRLINFSFFRS